MLRLFALIVLLHLYMGWRLLPDIPFGTGGIVAIVSLLALSACVMPFGQFARGNSHSALSDHLAGAGFVAMGVFSSLLVLTLLRDVVLLAGFGASGWLTNAVSLQRLRGFSIVQISDVHVGTTIKSGILS